MIEYKSYKSCFYGEKNNTSCSECKHYGLKNGFLGKHHSEKTKQKLSYIHKGNTYSPDSLFQKGRVVIHDPNFYNIWKEKYDEKTYNEKVKLHKEKISKLSSGKNNPMYGKPSPQGSGNGWSGWYKGWFFRSINELSYMVNIIERFNLTWETGERDKWKIFYFDYKNDQRNYFPDFIINNKYIVECKPKRLWSTPAVQSKAKAAINFCKKNNMIYKLVECRKLTINEMKNLYLNDKIIFLDKYKSKFIKLCQE